MNPNPTMNRTAEKRYRKPAPPIIPDSETFESFSDVPCEKVIASVIIDRPALLDPVNRYLSAERFTDEKYRDIYVAVSQLVEEGAVINPISIADRLEKNGSSVDSLSVMTLAIGTDVMTDSLDYHARRLDELYIKRRLWESGVRLSQQCCDPTLDIADIYDEHKRTIDHVWDHLDAGTEQLSSVCDRLRQRIAENLTRQPGEISGTPTGFPELDRLGGLCGSDLIVIGAETSVGKTSFANALVLGAIKSGAPVAYYSLEMTPEQLNARLVSMISRVDSRKILNERIENYELPAVYGAIDELEKYPLHFDGKSTASLESILSSIRHLKKKHGLKGVVVDYLQLVRVGSKELSREQEVARVARDLKNIAKELDIWIIALSQFSRDGKSHVPSMARLRDSGQIEEAADVILLLHRVMEEGGRYPAPFSDCPTKGTAQVMLTKGRNIGTGEWLVQFTPSLTLFSPLDDITLDYLKKIDARERQSQNKLAPF